MLDVLLEIWVVGTGCIFQDGSNYSDVGSCSDFDVAVTQVPSQNAKHSVFLSSCYGDMPLKVTPRCLLSCHCGTDSLNVQYTCSLGILLGLVQHDQRDSAFGAYTFYIRGGK